MKKIGLSCFEGFKCKAEKCRDNCCIGWEIDIDAATLEKYKNYKGALKERFEKCISYENTPHFILGEGERCPFLNKDGLCDIILDSGEDMLCEICDRHPRFYEWLPGITTEGYGIGCEQASEMLINCDKYISFTEAEISDTDEENDTDNKCGIVYDVLKTATKILQNRKAGFAYRLMTLLAFGSSVQNAVEADEYDVIPEIIARYSDDDFVASRYITYMRFETDSCSKLHHKLIDIYRSLESLDEKWHKHLALLYDEFDIVADCESEDKREHIWENMSIYFLFRHLPSAYFDDDFLSRIKFAVMSWLTIGLLMRVYHEDRLIPMAAMYSKEIEYSDENMSALLDATYTEECLSVQNLMAMLVRLRNL